MTIINKKHWLDITDSIWCTKRSHVEEVRSWGKKLWQLWFLGVKTPRIVWNCGLKLVGIHQISHLQKWSRFHPAMFQLSNLVKGDYKKGIIHIKISLTISWYPHNLIKESQMYSSNHSINGGKHSRNFPPLNYFTWGKPFFKGCSSDTDFTVSHRNPFSLSSTFLSQSLSRDLEWGAI